MSLWIKRCILFLLLEKVVQHIVVTVAFAYNWQQIRSTVVVNPTILLVAGALLALLFALNVWAMATGQRWALGLVIVLALCDIIGEFIAQGTFAITLNVSFVVAILLLFLAFLYQSRRRSSDLPMR